MLLVIYTARLEECRAFYSELGFTLAPEQHGSGPLHYSTRFSRTTLCEFYPASDRSPATGPGLRLSLTLRPHPASPSPLPPGDHTLTDPDGRRLLLSLPASG